MRALLFAFLLGCNNDPTPPDAAAYPPPAESCSADAGVEAGIVCAPPKGGCADQHWLYYYDNGKCEQGQCSWSTSFFYCAEQCTFGYSGNGACLNSGETAPYYGP